MARQQVAALVDFDANIIIGAAIGTVLTSMFAALRRYLSRTKFWRGIERTTRSTIGNPDIPVDDPREAAERALVEAQRPQIEAVARKVSQSTPPPFATE